MTNKIYLIFIARTSHFYTNKKEPVESQRKNLINNYVSICGIILTGERYQLNA